MKSDKEYCSASLQQGSKAPEKLSFYGIVGKKEKGVLCTRGIVFADGVL